MIAELKLLAEENNYLYVSLSNGSSFTLSFINEPLKTKGKIVYANVAGVNSNGTRKKETKLVFEDKDIVSIQTTSLG